MNGYFTVKDCECRLCVSRSKFLAFLYRCGSEEEAAEKIAALKKRFHDARHVCYAYRLGENGDRARASDDGEPQGTAGAPLLSALKGAEVTDALIAVVRYFGGIKLGVGGLTRTYASCAGRALELSGRVEVAVYSRYTMTADFKTYESLRRVIAAAGGRIEDVEYGAEVKFSLLCRSEAEKLKEALLSAAGGKLKIAGPEETYREISDAR